MEITVEWLNAQIKEAAEHTNTGFIDIDAYHNGKIKALVLCKERLKENSPFCPIQVAQMKCPDCGGEMVKISLFDEDGELDCWHCSKCHKALPL